MATRPFGITWKQHSVLLICAAMFLSVQTENGIKGLSFQGHDFIHEVVCSGETLDAGWDVLSMVLYECQGHKVLATVNLRSQECSTGDSFSSCFIDNRDTRNTRISSLITDLAGGESKEYGCNITSFKSGTRAYFLSWKTTITQIQTTTTTVSTTTSTTTTTQPPASRNVNGRPVASGVQGELHDFYLPPVVLVIGLILIIVLALLSLVLIVLQCHKAGRRKKRNRAANRESLLSAKSEIAGCSTGSKDLDLGVTTYRATRSFPSFAPGPQQGPMPVGPPAHFAMRYQKGPPDDTGYVSGSSNHYSEPYGCHEDGTQDRTRPTSRPGLPQVKGSPQPPRLPDNHP